MSHPALPQPELTLGKYQIVRPLKVGGTAAIYLAVLRGENNFSREVVIKRPLPHLVSDHRARLMFIDEAHIASRLSHPNICQVLDLVARDTELYLVLEYLKGLDLREVLKRSMELGRLVPPEIAVWIAIEVAAGLDFAHEACAIDGAPLNLVHRDVSPKNIRITDSGSVKVIDFGIARAINRATETAAGTIKGTLGYMSPEQILGDEIDRRSDIFAFGIVLFQMLTCRNPFDGPTLKERVRRLTQAPVPSVREFNGALDDEIDGIVHKCLMRDVEERYQHMRDVQLDLDRYLSRLQTSSPRQRLILYLEEIFPNVHETDPELKNVLTEISSITGKIDSSQRLLFPDDEGGQRASLQTQPTVKADGTSSTIRDAAFVATNTASAASAASATAYRATLATDAGAPQDTLRRTDAFQGADTVQRSVRPQRTQLPWLPIGIGLLLVSIIVAVGVVWMSDRWSSSPIASDSQEDRIVSDMKPKKEPGANAIVAPISQQAATSTAAHVQQAVVKEPHETPVALVPHDIAGSAPVREHKAPAADASAGGQGKDNDRARLYFMTALRLQQKRMSDEALFMYTLAFRESGRKVNPAIFRNIGLLQNELGNRDKARACLRGYLERSGGAPDAERIRTLVSSYSDTKTIPCVDAVELAQAKKLAQRKGAVIDNWVNETLEEKLR